MVINNDINFNAFYKGDIQGKTYKAIIHAKWTANSYKVSFDAQAEGITLSFTEKDVIYGEKFGELPTVAERSGYEFKGWYSNTTEGRQLTEDTIVDILADRTYYGVWEAKRYKVTLELNGGNIKSGDISEYIYGQATKLPTELENGSRIFAGWYMTEDFTDDAVTEISADSIGDKTFYAKWIDTAVNNTVIDITELDISAGTELEQAANEAAKNEIMSNDTVKAPAADLNDAVDKNKLEDAVNNIIEDANKDKPDTEPEIKLNDVKEVKLGLEIKPKAILSEEENGEAAVTGIKFEAKPYLSIVDKDNNEIGKTAVGNDALNGRVTVKLPVPDQLKGKYAKIVHVFSDGSGEETIRCTIKGISPERYVEFTVDKFSEFNIEFTDDYYALNDVASLSYTGRYLKPDVVVKAGDTTVSKSEYSVEYRNNINVGQAEITVIINSTGERLSKTFDITKARPVIKADNVTAVYDGSRHGVQISVNIPDGISLGSNYYKCRYYTDAACTKNESADAPVNVGTYYALITVDETDNFFAAEKKLEVKINAKKSSASSSGSSSGGSGGSGGGSGTVYPLSRSEEIRVSSE